MNISNDATRLCLHSEQRKILILKTYVIVLNNLNIHFIKDLYMLFCSKSWTFAYGAMKAFHLDQIYLSPNYHKSNQYGRITSKPQNQTNIEIQKIYQTEKQGKCSTDFLKMSTHKYTSWSCHISFSPPKNSCVYPQ